MTKVLPGLTVTVFEPSSPDATKSLPDASDTVTFTVAPAVVSDTDTVNPADEPSVTGEVPAAMVMVFVCAATGVANDAKAAKTAGKSRRREGIFMLNTPSTDPTAFSWRRGPPRP